MFITLFDGYVVERGSFCTCASKFYGILKEREKLDDFVKYVKDDSMKAAYFDTYGTLHTMVVKEATIV